MFQNFLQIRLYTKSRTRPIRSMTDIARFGARSFRGYTLTGDHQVVTWQYHQTYSFAFPNHARDAVGMKTERSGENSHLLLKDNSSLTSFEDGGWERVGGCWWGIVWFSHSFEVIQAISKHRSGSRHHLQVQLVPLRSGWPDFFLFVVMNY